MSRSTVMIVEDHETTRASLVAKVSADPTLQVVADVGTLADAKRRFAELEPDVLLVDLELPDGTGTDLIEQASEDAHTLVISVFGDEKRVVSAIRSGAKGYLLKDDDAKEVSVAIHQLLNGESPISPAIARHLISQFQQHAACQTDVSLSSREQDVLTLASKGYTYAEIADLMNVSANTVGTYTKRIYTKLEVNSKAAAVYEARRLGLMDD